MKTSPKLLALAGSWLRLTLWVLLGLTAPTNRGSTLDDFNGATKTGWADFTFQAGFGIPIQTNGQFRFEQPPAGQAIFSASQKDSQTFELKEGRTIEFRIDVIQGGGKDSFAILAFIPTENSPGTLSGYGFAKSTTDLLITKGINKYFAAVSGTPADLKQDNVRLILNLTARHGSVFITAKALDLDDNLKVLWQQTVEDSPAADVLVSGTDTPAAPFLTKGYFSLYLYQDFDKNAPENPYRVVYDHAETFVTDNVVLDDFNGPTKTDWSDFTFVPGFGLPTQTNGQFRFEQPPAGQSLFSASQKKSRVFDLTEGNRVQFDVDVIQGGEKDSFAILAFIPTENSAGTLSGYGLAKSTTDLLITKGINKYFVAETGAAAALKQNHITLSLTLSVRNGAVEINARVLDQDDGNKVIYERTVIDTTAADVLVSGTDDPKAPFITGGYFTLYLYQDFDKNAPESPYRALFDNAVAGAPPAAANVAPIISEVLPTQTASFLPSSTRISFKVADDKLLDTATISVLLNGTRITATNGLTLAGTGLTRIASVGGLAENKNYVAHLIALDAEGAGVTNVLSFDTFLPTDLAVEIEDYNFGGGQFIDHPVPTAEGSTVADAYNDLTGTQDIDFNDTRTSPRAADAPYRTQDPIRMQRSLDSRRAQYVTAGGAENVNGVYDYDVGDLATGEWMNYTRTFAPGSYEVYLREAIANLAQGESVLELVTGDRTKTNQTVRLLGSFLGVRTGFEYRNFPLTDGGGQNKVIVRLTGLTTLRLRHVTADTSDSSRYLNYLLFVPVADPGLQRASVTSLSPAPDSTTETVAPKITVTLQNHETTVVPASMKLTLNGHPTIPQVTPTADGFLLELLLSPLPAAGALNAVHLTFADNLGVSQSNDWNFTITYASLDPASRNAGTGKTPGLNVRVVQAPIEGGLLENSLQRAESQLAANSTIPKAYETSVVATVINYSQNGPDASDGYFDGDSQIPGASTELGNENYAMEVRAFLRLPAGITRFGVRCDDGYKLASASTLDANTIPLAFHNGGPADETVDVVVPVAGLYPFRLVWYERSGGAFVEWFTVNPVSGDRTLVNASGGIAAFLEITAPAITLQSTAQVGVAFTPEGGAMIDPATKTITVAQSGETRLYRLSGAVGLQLLTVKINGNQVVITYKQN